MSAHSAILLLCVLLTILGVANVWLIRKFISARKALAAEQLAHGNSARNLAIANARINTLETVGHEMYLELQSKAYSQGYLGYIVPCLEKKISALQSQARSMSARRFAEEKREVGVSIVELLLAVFFPGKCGRANAV
jgi:hypothetical protein